MTVNFRYRLLEAEEGVHYQDSRHGHQPQEEEGHGTRIELDKYLANIPILRSDQFLRK